jgi:tryptophanase
VGVDAAQRFTGNVDLARLASVLEQGNVALVGIQSFADGQHPISLANLRAVRDSADRHGVLLVVDGSRVVENAWYVQRHEQAQRERSIAQI